MSGKIEYLEKYSVAPPPSRDYYGLKVLNNEVVLYTWKISHGPHKTPIAHIVPFDHFEQDRNLHNEIRRGFGEHLLEHVKNIAHGNKTLLTLPKCLIQRLIKYLSVCDVLKLSSLSHAADQVFGDNSVWEILCKRYKPMKHSKLNKNYDMVRNWKELFKEESMEPLIKAQKNARTYSSIKSSKPKVEKQHFINIKLPQPKAISNINLLANISPTKCSETPRSISQDYVLKKSNRVNSLVSDETLKTGAERKESTTKSLQINSQKKLKTLRDQSAVTKVGIKSEGNISTSKKISELNVFKGYQNVEKPPSKSKLKSTFIKPRTSDSEKTIILGDEKADFQKQQGNASKSKARSKVKKLKQNKSATVSTPNLLANDALPIKDEALDIFDLIKTSLYDSQTPRTVSNYEFSRFKSSKMTAGEILKSERRRITNMSSAKKTVQQTDILDRLSEKSEPLSAKSTDTSKKVISSYMVPIIESYRNAHADKTIKPVVSENSLEPATKTENKVENIDPDDGSSRYFTAKKPINVDEKPHYRRADKMDVLRSFDADRFTNRKLIAPERTFSTSNSTKFGLKQGSKNEHFRRYN